MPTTQFDEIKSVFNCEPNIPEEADRRNEYLIGIVHKIRDASEGDWDKLATETQEWYNRAAKAVNAQQPIPPPEGFPGVEPAQIQSVPDATPQAEAPVTQEEIAKPPAEVKPERSKFSPKHTRVGRSKGLMDAIRRVVITRPDLNAKGIYLFLTNQGFTVNLETVTVNTSDVRKVIEIARELGYWNDNPNPPMITGGTVVPAEEQKTEEPTNNEQPADETSVPSN